MEPVRKFPNEAPRVESGPVQFGDDWPGVFIRGDNALYFGFVLRQLLDGHSIGVIESATLKSLSALLLACDVRQYPIPTPQPKEAP